MNILLHYEVQLYNLYNRRFVHPGYVPRGLVRRLSENSEENSDISMQVSDSDDEEFTGEEDEANGKYLFEII